jgi:hypothetical protein
MRCVILQPSFVPWRGYFHQIKKADVFVFYDDVQFDKHGWRNRNRIKTSSGTQWLTIPIRSGGVVTNGTPICDVEIAWERGWWTKHMATLEQAYRKASFFERYLPLLEKAYDARPRRLVDLTVPLTLAIASELGIDHTRFVLSSELGIGGRKTDRLLAILERLGATHYISGPAARDYLEQERFEEAGISLEFMTYEYPEYPQAHPPFDPFVSILDLLFAVGPQAPSYIWGLDGEVAANGAGRHVARSTLGERDD